MKPLVSDEVNQGLNKIVQKLFEGNRIFDRGMSILSVKFAMNKTEAILHPKLAHLYPSLADKVSGYQDSRNSLTDYLITFTDVTDYTSPLDFFNRIYDYMISLEEMIYEVIDMAKEDSDIATKVFLENFLLSILPVTGQCILLRDKCEKYNDMMQFDHNIEDFVTL